MSELTKAWLLPFDWEFVTEVNRGLCKQKNALHKPTSDGHSPARQLWEENQTKKLKLAEALQICQRCHRLAPFCFYNGNTFAGIARDFVAELNSLLTPQKAYVLRSVAGHIVAGTATDIETEQLDRILEELEK
ncbi:MAG TPA: hypothetical protein VFC07_02305 [Verrucomicrobiae bacterium]|nr:hypothetical protein [Verrucomicrobiae bacterium]